MRVTLPKEVRIEKLRKKILDLQAAYSKFLTVRDNLRVPSDDRVVRAVSRLDRAFSAEISYARYTLYRLDRFDELAYSDPSYVPHHNQDSDGVAHHRAVDHAPTA